MSLGLIFHFYSESLLLPHFVRHYLPLIDSAIGINHRSTDNSVEIIKSLAPHWRVVDTGLNEFDARQNDLECMEYEKELKTKWKFISNVTEFLFIPDLKNRLEEIEKTCPSGLAFGIRTVSLVDKEQLSIIDPIWANRTHGYINYEKAVETTRRYRYIHKAPQGEYELGRHATRLPYVDIPELLLLHFGLSPWPECINRILQVQERIPQKDKDIKAGWEHIVTLEQLKERRLKMLEQSYDLMLDENYKRCYTEILRGP